MPLKEQGGHLAITGGVGFLGNFLDEDAKQLPSRVGQFVSVVWVGVNKSFYKKVRDFPQSLVRRPTPRREEGWGAVEWVEVFVAHRGEGGGDSRIVRWGALKDFSAAGLEAVC